MSLASDRRLSRAVTFGRAIVDLYRDRDVPFMAASIAYAAFVSLLPAVLLLFIVASVVGGEALQGYVVQFTERHFTPTTQGVLQESILGATEQVEYSLLAVVTLLWAALKVFRALDTAFSKLYGDDSRNGFLDQMRDGLVAVGGMGLATLTMIAVGAVLALAAEPVNVRLGSRLPVVEILSVAALLVGLTVAFVPLFYVFPDVPVTLGEVLPGAIVAAVGWTLLQGLFQVYVSWSSASRLYGVVGGVILVITWLYFGAVVVLLGASTNVVLAGRVGDPASVVAE